MHRSTSHFFALFQPISFPGCTAQTALHSFSKMTFIWKYYEVCKRPLTSAREAEDGCKEEKIL